MKKGVKKARTKGKGKGEPEKRVLLHRLNEVLKPTKSDGKTAYWLAEKTGISYNTIHNYLHNRMEPSLSKLKKIAEALELNGKDLINF